MKTVTYHWLVKKYMLPPCGKVSMYKTENKDKVTCPDCRKAIEVTEALTTGHS